jgi:hypothetical protein
MFEYRSAQGDKRLHEAGKAPQGLAGFASGTGRPAVLERPFARDSKHDVPDARKRASIQAPAAMARRSGSSSTP